MAESDFKFPTSAHRQLVVGTTGSGKTQAAVWNLAHRNLKSAPWIALNHKGDELLNSIEGAQHVDLDFIPKKPGLYVYHPVPENDDDAVRALLWAIHRKGNIGVYVDEGYMISPRDPAQNALLTQGRSKKIPMIISTQRPVGLTRLARSESDFFQVFYLKNKDDRKVVQEFIPVDLEELMVAPVNEEPKLPRYHSLWYDVHRNRLFKMQPVPSADDILDMFRPQLPQTKRTKVFI
jgi:hypothetical protein